MSVWPESVARSFGSPPVRSQSLIVASSEAEATSSAVGREGHGADRPLVPAQRGPLAAPGHVPELHRSVRPARGERPAVGRKRDGPNRAAVAFEVGEFLPGGDVPELDVLVVSARGQKSGRRAKRRPQ